MRSLCHLLLAFVLLPMIGDAGAQKLPDAFAPHAVSKEASVPRPRGSFPVTAAPTTTPAPAFRDNLNQLITDWTREDPEAALTFLAQRVDAPLRTRLLLPALRQWAEADAPAASIWVMGHSSSQEEKSLWLREVISGLAHRDAAEALLWFALMSSDVRERFDGSENIDWKTYLRAMPADAARRIPDMPASVLKNQLAAAFSRTLAQTDSVAAHWWAEELTDLPARAAALAALRSS